jgi:hypothetical protein
VFSDYEANLLAAPFDLRTLRLLTYRGPWVCRSRNGIFAVSETGTSVPSRHGHGRTAGVGGARWHGPVVDSAWARILSIALSPMRRSWLSVSRGAAPKISGQATGQGPFLASRTTGTDIPAGLVS